jgi:AraC-like DNA-binding protein
MNSTRSFADSGFRVQHCISATPHRPHAHLDYTFAYIFSGRVNTRVGAKTVLSFGPREANLLNPGEVHEDLPCAGTREYLVLGLKEALFKDITGELGVQGKAQPSFPCPKINADHQIQRLCEAIRYEMDHDEWGRELILRSAVTELAVELLRGFCGLTFRSEICDSERTNLSLKLQRAAEYMNDNYTVRFNLSEISASAGLSKYYFDRAFKKAFGISPQRYFLTLRLDRAKEILSGPAARRKPLAEIALNLGFADQSHFTNAFRRYSGMTPREFRQLT